MSGEVLLAVDDHPINLKLIRALLESDGYDVRTAIDAETAFLELRTLRPRVILMDLQLPGMDGYELTRLLKRSEATRDIPIAAVTSYAMKGDEDRARDAGCDAYVTKPIDAAVLRQTVGEFTRRETGSFR